MEIEYGRLHKIKVAVIVEPRHIVFTECFTSSIFTPSSLFDFRNALFRTTALCIIKIYVRPMKRDPVGTPATIHHSTIQENAELRKQGASTEECL